LCVTIGGIGSEVAVIDAHAPQAAAQTHAVTGTSERRTDMRMDVEKGGDAKHILTEVKKAQAEFDKARLEILQKMDPKTKAILREAGKELEK